MLAVELEVERDGWLVTLKGNELGSLSVFVSVSLMVFQKVNLSEKLKVVVLEKVLAF